MQQKIGYKMLKTLCQKNRNILHKIDSPGGLKAPFPLCYDMFNELDTTEIALPLNSENSLGNFSKDAIQKYRDVLKSTVVMKDEKIAYILLGIENQTDIHYAMPVRNMIYDALQYNKQIADIATQHQAEPHTLHKPSHAEYLSGFYKNDKLIPVITLVIHFGANARDGPLSLHEMMDIQDEHLLKFVQDYKIHLIDLLNLQNQILKNFPQTYIN